MGPVELAYLCRRAPSQVLSARFREQVVTGLFQAVGEVEQGGVLGNQGPVPWSLAPGRLTPGGVEGWSGGAEVARRPRPLGLKQPQQVQEVVGRVGGPGLLGQGQPA